MYLIEYTTRYPCVCADVLCAYEDLSATARAKCPPSYLPQCLSNQTLFIARSMAHGAYRLGRFVGW